MPYDKIDALDLRRTVEAAKERKERQDLNLQRAKLAIEQQKMAAYQNMMNTQAQNNMLQNAYSQGLGATQGLAGMGGALTIGGLGTYDNPYGWVQMSPGGVGSTATYTVPLAYAITREYVDPEPYRQEPEPVREVAAGERALDLEVTPMEISVTAPTREIDL